MKLSMSLIKKARVKYPRMAKTFKVSPNVAKAIEKQASLEGCKQVHLMEKMVVYYLNHGGIDAKIT